MITLFESYPEFRDAALAHTEGFVLPADDARHLLLGFLCAKCGEGWQISVRKIRDNVDSTDLMRLKDDLAALPNDKAFAAEYVKRQGLCTVFAENHTCPETYSTKQMIHADNTLRQKFSWLCAGCETIFTTPFTGELELLAEPLQAVS